MPKALALIGPTASGKTALAIEFAKTYPCEIISIDSALVYRGMDIGSAKPTKAEQAGIAHHLIDICEPNEPYSAADFVKDAESSMAEIASRNRLPFLVGGTMLYANALFYGIDEMPKADLDVRAEVMREARESGWPAMHAKLEAVDPVTAERLSINDSQRIGRALEVYRQTGRPLSSFQTGKKDRYPDIVKIGLMPTDRAKLHMAIRKRFLAMIEAGFLDEVRTLMARDDFDASTPAMRSVGYRQAILYLEGKTTKEAFIEDACTATRRLAKHQITWMRSMPGLILIDAQAQDVRERFFEKAREALNL
ncbi:MAG TPA: tRNA (adenosine(37)-N6)-dimethylallyltransferase MiaA [Sutterella sp.]|nr:tRNA (adenosine(37)-N6)-dimethylallyltransferase MiaA [Sutterella sp.]